MQGIFLLWMLLLFSFLSAKVNLKKIPWWVYCLLLYVELFVTFFLPLNASHRYVGTLGEPNALAAFALFLWVFGWFSVGTQNSAPLHAMFKKMLLFLPTIVLLYLSGSKSGMIAFGIVLLFIFLQRINVSLRKTVFICLCLYAISYALPFFHQTPYENRVEIWESALYAGLINPILGQGFGNTEIALHNAAAGLGLPIQYYYVDSSHNIFLDWWVQGEVVGISLLIVLVYSAFRCFVQQDNKRELALLLGIMTMLSFNPASVVGLLGFWWVIGQNFTNSDYISECLRR